MTNYNHFEEKSLENHQTSSFFAKVTLTTKKTAGMLVTEVRSGDAPKPPLSIETNNKFEKSENLG